jgi:hypothetical protein
MNWQSKKKIYLEVIDNHRKKYAVMSCALKIIQILF